MSSPGDRTGSGAVRTSMSNMAGVRRATVDDIHGRVSLDDAGPTVCQVGRRSLLFFRNLPPGRGRIPAKSGAAALA